MDYRARLYEVWVVQGGRQLSGGNSSWLRFNSVAAPDSEKCDSEKSGLCLYIKSHHSRAKKYADGSRAQSGATPQGVPVIGVRRRARSRDLLIH